MARGFSTCKKFKVMYNQWNSRKFWVFVSLFVTSLGLAEIHPVFVGNADTLFNFWTMLAGIFFGADVYSRYQAIKNTGSIVQQNKWAGRKFWVFVCVLGFSLGFALFSSTLVVKGSTLFTFWAQVCGLYFSANVVDKQLLHRANRTYYNNTYRYYPSAKVPRDVP